MRYILIIEIYDEIHKSNLYETDMTPDQLLTFAAVAESGSISRAADILHLTQPAVSGQLRLLQEDFGQPLYRRAGRGIRLTETGEHLAALARQMRQTYERIRDLRIAIAGLRAGSLAIGASTTPASYLLPYMVAAFRRSYPAVDIKLTSGNTTDILEQLARFDLAFIEDAIPADLPADVASFEWRRDEVVAIVGPGHPLARNVRAAPTVPVEPNTLPVAAPQPAIPGAARLTDLARYPLIMREAGSGVRRQVMDAFSAAGLQTRIAIELAGVEGVKEAVRAGLGVGFVSAMAMQHGDPSLVALRVDPPQGIGRRIGVLIPHADLPGAPVRGFLTTFFPGEENAWGIQSRV